MLIIYVLYHISGGFLSDLDTSPAVLVSQERSVTATARIIRDEKIIFSDVSGTVSYLYTDGEKVAVNTDVAEIYSSSSLSEESKKRIVDIDSKIRLLESSNMSSSEKRSDTSSTDLLIKSSLFSYLDYAGSGDISAAQNEANNMLVQLNRKNIIVGETKDYNSQISALKSEKKSLYSGVRSTSKIKTDKPGYFWSSIDGYEEIFKVSDIDGFTYSSYKELSETPAREYGTGGKNPIGKLVTDYMWYIACEVDRNQLHHYETGKRYSVIFPMSSGTSVDMTLYRILTDINADTVILIFRTGDLPENFRYLRTQTVQIVEKTYTGYRIPVSAVRINKDDIGVYVLKGSQIVFKKVDILYEYDGYFVVTEQSVHSSDEGNWLAKNDLVIVKGKKLNDGRIVI